jgi:hypothetical protein
VNDTQRILTAIASMEARLSSRLDTMSAQHGELIDALESLQSDMRSLIGDGEGNPGRVGELETAQTFNRAIGWASILAALLAIGVALAR